MVATAVTSIVESPCNKICAIDPVSALCVGCGRNLQEIESWLRCGDDERRRIMEELPLRLASLRRAMTGNAP
jgi:predicted Fe-S protein YdhL (DUF1289 family)